VTEKDRQTLSDEQLMRSLAEGGTHALGVLYERYRVLVMKAVARTAPEVPMAQVEDITQDVFLAVRDGASAYDEQKRFKAWLYGIAVNKAKVWRRNTWLRRRLLGERSDEPVGRALDRSMSRIEQIEARESVLRALHELPENMRQTLILHAVEGFSCDEISRIFKISPKTVRTRLHRARGRLMEILSLQDPVPAGSQEDA